MSDRHRGGMHRIEETWKRSVSVCVCREDRQHMGVCIIANVREICNQANHLADTQYVLTCDDEGAETGRQRQSEKEKLFYGTVCFEMCSDFGS